MNGDNDIDYIVKVIMVSLGYVVFRRMVAIHQQNINWMLD